MFRSKKFLLEHILFCVAAALGKRGFCNTTLEEIHLYLTGTKPFFMAPAAHEVATVICGLALLEQYPKLKKPVEASLDDIRPGHEPFKDDAAFAAWLAPHKSVFGSSLKVKPLTACDRRKFEKIARTIAQSNLDAKTGRRQR